jgi:hypothetical protein
MDVRHACIWKAFTISTHPPSAQTTALKMSLSARWYLTPLWLIYLFTCLVFVSGHNTRTSLWNNHIVVCSFRKKETGLKSLISVYRFQLSHKHYSYCFYSWQSSSKHQWQKRGTSGFRRYYERSTIRSMSFVWNATKRRETVKHTGRGGGGETDKATCTDSMSGI